MRFDRENVEYRLGIAPVWLMVFLLLVVLLVFHGVAVSFLIPNWYEMSATGRGFGFLAVGGFSVWVDIVSYRYIKGQMDRSRWTAEIKREHESQNS